MSGGQAPRRALRLVPPPAPATERLEIAHFCGRCGAAPAQPRPGQSPQRVCQSCHLGVVLSTVAVLAPRPAQPFLIVDRLLTVCALSEAAEELLETTEDQAVNRHVAEFLVPARAEARGSEDLLTTIIAAATDDQPVRDVVVRPAHEFGVRLWARIGACGPPPAVLLTLSDQRPGPTAAG